jgi:hypothetical protein
VTGQEELLEDYPLVRELVGQVDVTSRFEQFVAIWGVLNYVPLQQFKEGGAYVARYDRLVAEPEAEYRKVFEYLGKPWPGVVISEVLNRPSKTNYQQRDFEEGAAKARSGWEGVFSEDEKRRAGEILGVFGLQGEI